MGGDRAEGAVAGPEDNGLAPVATVLFLLNHLYPYLIHIVILHIVGLNHRTLPKASILVSLHAAAYPSSPPSEK